MPSISLTSVSNYVLKDVSFTVRDGEFMVLLGHNGAGKSTLLNIIAGLIPYQGSVRFDDSPVDDISTEKRNVGYLSQDLALFPHMKVRANIGYGLRMRPDRKRSKIDHKVDALLEMMNIRHLGDRYARDLSGGEKQRVALARAMAIDPKVLLMDEPLNSLDLMSAKYLRTEIRHLQKKLRATTLFVTHSLDEASEIADRIAVMDNGEILQVGTPDEIIFSPAEVRVRNFIGEPNIFECRSSRILENGLAVSRCGRLEIISPYEGTPIHKIAIQPEHVYVSTIAPAGPHINRFQGVVREIKHYPSMVRLTIEVAGQPILAQLPKRLSRMQAFTEGSEVYLILKLRWLQVLNSGAQWH